jgi:hypothetical protein
MSRTDPRRGYPAARLTTEDERDLGDPPDAVRKAFPCGHPQSVRWTIPCVQSLLRLRARAGDLRSRADSGIAQDKALGVECDVADKVTGLEANDTIS